MLMKHQFLKSVVVLGAMLALVNCSEEAAEAMDKSLVETLIHKGTAAETLLLIAQKKAELEKLEKNLRARKHTISIITGHTGWTDDLDFAFKHRSEICRPFTKKYTDSSAPYDGYIEDDDTEESARSILLRKVIGSTLS